MRGSPIYRRAFLFIFFLLFLYQCNYQDMSFKQSAKEYFTFNKKEKRALLILSVLIVLLAISPSLMLLLSPDEKTDYKVFEAAVKKFYAGQTNASVENDKSNNEMIQKDFAANAKIDSVISGKNVVELFVFDPNTATENDFAKLGLNTRTIASIINYRNKNGRFISGIDFKKIYTLSDEDFNRLKDFIVIPNSNQLEKTSEQKSFASYHPIVLDINSADSIEWVNLPGIGPYLTSRILKYKYALGGFSSVDQIAEVYGMKPETIELIKEKIRCDDQGGSSIRKINLNTATKEELNAHPYINTKQAMIIINFRIQHGAFNRVEDLLNADCFNTLEFDKIKPYLSVK